MPDREIPPDGPLGCRWMVRHTHVTNPKTSTLEFYRNELDYQLEAQVTWDPYPRAVLAGLPHVCTEGRNIWRSRTPLICFQTIERHVPDRVLRQFGLRQHIPEPIPRVARVNAQGQSQEYWITFHATNLADWDVRHDIVVHEHEDLDPDPVRVTRLYMDW